jgi:RNA polymerase sigma factor (sigma-70 family)
MDDTRLLIDFVATGSQTAFAQIVRHHVDLVYAAAYRHVRDEQLAQDITQAVFLLLARKAGSLRHEAVLAAWLLRATRYASLDAIKLRQRRRNHEMEASQLNQAIAKDRCAAADAERAELLGMLDEAMARLSEADRRVLVLRFYEKRSFPEIGAALATTDESARKRVARSIERLRAIFARRGNLVAIGAVVGILSVALGDCAKATPPGLAVRVASSAATTDLASSIVARVARKMFFAQARLVAVAACASVVVCVLGGVFVHSLLLHHDHPTPTPATTVAEEHDRAG